MAYNQTLRAQRLNIDQNRAEEITAALKPNPTFTTLVDTIRCFPRRLIRLTRKSIPNRCLYYEREANVKNGYRLRKTTPM